MIVGQVGRGRFPGTLTPAEIEKSGLTDEVRLFFKFDDHARIFIEITNESGENEHDENLSSSRSL